MIVNMIWHVVQKVDECYFVPQPQLSYIYWLIHFNRRVKSVPAVRIEISSDKMGSCNHHLHTHSGNVIRATGAIRWRMVFFNLHLRRTKCSVCLTNLTFLLTRSSRWNDLELNFFFQLHKWNESMWSCAITDTEHAQRSYLTVAQLSVA